MRTACYLPLTSHRLLLTTGPYVPPTTHRRPIRNAYYLLQVHTYRLLLLSGSEPSTLTRKMHIRFAAIPRHAAAAADSADSIFAVPAVIFHPPVDDDVCAMLRAQHLDGCEVRPVSVVSRLRVHQRGGQVLPPAFALG